MAWYPCKNVDLGGISANAFNDFLSSCTLLTSQAQTNISDAELTVSNLSQYRWLIFVGFKASDGYTIQQFKIPNQILMMSYEDFKKITGNTTYYGATFANDTSAGGCEALVSYVSDTKVHVTRKQITCPFYMYGMK